MPEEDLMFDPDVHESEQSVWDRIFNAMEEIWKEDDTCQFSSLSLPETTC